MDENVKVIFEGIKNALGESSSVITDRTIEQTINEFSAFAPQENAEKFWNESVVNHLKNTVAGQVRALKYRGLKTKDVVKSLKRYGKRGIIPYKSLDFVQRTTLRIPSAFSADVLSLRKTSAENDGWLHELSISIPRHTDFPPPRFP